MTTHTDRLKLKLAQDQLQLLQQPPLNLVELCCNPVQLDFIRNPALFKAWIATRRSSKSTGAAIGAIQICLDKPNAKVLYIGLTEEAILKTVYHEIFTNIFLKYQIPAELKYQNEIVFNNGSRIYCVGTDSSKRDRERCRGFKGALIVIDECQSHENDLRILIEDVIGPTLADTKSPIWLLGTQGNKHGSNYWFEIHYKKLHPQWTTFQSSWEDNTSIDSMTGKRVCDNVRDYLTNLIDHNPAYIESDGYKQEWGNDWAISSDAKIYKGFTANNIPPTSPTIVFLHGATFILGIDLGANDPTAFVILAYNLKYSPKAYIIDSYQRPHMLVPDIVTKIKELDHQYHFSFMVADSANLQIVETLQQYYSLPIQKANKQGKQSHQYTLNSDFVLNQMEILSNNVELISQLQTVIWKESKLAEGKYIEDPYYPNDLTDALLYAHHFSRHMWYREPTPPAPIATQFHQAILQGERVASRYEFINQSKQRFNPYQKTIK